MCCFENGEELRIEHHAKEEEYGIYKAHVEGSICSKFQSFLALCSSADPTVRKSIAVMKFSLLCLASLAAALPSASLGKRQEQELCDQYEYWSGNGYEVNNNLWGQDSGTGSQCTYIDGSSDSGLQWHTQWQWEGSPNEVKSYVNSGKMFDRGRTISSISSMQTSASWQYDTDVRANVAYDIFTAEDPNHATSGGDYEVMIW